MRKNLKIFRGLKIFRTPAAARPRGPARLRFARHATRASLTKIHRNLGDFECVEPGELYFLEGK